MARRADGRRRLRPARVDGREVDFAEAVEAAAAILSEARLPLVCGLAETDCESQRAAVALAEAIGAVIDPVGPTDAGAAAAASQAFGLSTATFGDVRDRADVAVAWRADPVTTHPRLLPRLRLDRAGARPAVDRPHAGRHRRTSARETAEEADVFIELPPELDFEALWAMRALVGDIPLDRDARRPAAARRPRAARRPPARAVATAPCSTARDLLRRRMAT